MGVSSWGSLIDREPNFVFQQQFTDFSSTLYVLVTGLDTHKHTKMNKI